MAQINMDDDTRVLQIKKWLGLNESPDGDSGLKNGEAAEMRNFRITRENHLQLRPGYAPVCTVAEGNPIRGMWTGYVNTVFHLLVSCGGHLWDVNPKDCSKVDLGAIDDTQVSFFGFEKKVYILTGAEYYCWTGSGNVSIVEGYVPTVATATVPSGGGTILESVNKLNGKRKQQFSPNGTDKVFNLVETGIDKILSVDGTSITYTADVANGSLTFASAPPKGVNTITITWEKGEGVRKDVTAMRFAELYNGASDSRVFLYGDGTNRALYSGLDSNGSPTAEYFPDLNIMTVDSANTPITAMIRHYDRLLVFKMNSAYSAQYSTMTLADERVTAAFYTSSINREIGCAAPGQARLVNNNPRTLFGRGVYEWALTVGSIRDERNAKRLSDRVEATLGTFALENALTFDDESTQEYYIFNGNDALIHNYANDTWYYYDHFPVLGIVSVNGELYFGTPNGHIMHFSRIYRKDGSEPIKAYWESGSMDFGQDWKRKYSSNVWVAMKPEGQAVVTMKAQSNVKSDYVGRVVSSGLINLKHANFAHWSFGVNRKPQVIRARMKVKKFTFYKLIFESVSSSATSTILSADIQIRYTGTVK